MSTTKDLSRYQIGVLLLSCVLVTGLVTWVWLVPAFMMSTTTARNGVESKLNINQVSGTLNQVDVSAITNNELVIETVQNMSADQDVTCNELNLVDADVYTPDMTLVGLEPVSESSTTRVPLAAYQYTDGLLSLMMVLIYPLDAENTPSASITNTTVSITFSLPAAYAVAASGLLVDPLDDTKLIPFSSGQSALWDAGVNVTNHELYLVASGSTYQAVATFTFSATFTGHGAFRCHLAYPASSV